MRRGIAQQPGVPDAEVSLQGLSALFRRQAEGLQAVSAHWRRSKLCRSREIAPCSMRAMSRISLIRSSR